MLLSPKALAVRKRLKEDFPFYSQAAMKIRTKEGEIKPLVLNAAQQILQKAIDEEMAERGVVRGGAGLRPPADATTVRVRDDEVVLTDGPFAETKEQIGGFVLIECADLDEAIEIASKHPAAAYGTIEIRPLYQP